MKLSDYIFSKLEVEHVFMLPGGGCMHLVDSLGKSNITAVSCLHEQACAFAAQAYGELKGLGVALVTTGPGGTNALTGVAAAWVESSPLLILSGQVKTSDRMTEGMRSKGQQEIDIISMVKPVTKYAVTITDKNTVRYHLEKAIYEATHGRRGPVWLDIPLDIQAAEIEPETLQGYKCREEDTISWSNVEEVIELLKKAKRPVLLLGNGVKSAHLVQILNIPTLLTWKAMDLLDEDHPLYRGRPGGIGQRYANFTLQNCDLLIAVGARLDMPSIAFNQEHFAFKAKKIMVDIDQSEIDKMENVQGICMDATMFTLMLKTLDVKVDCNEWIGLTAKWKEKYPVLLAEHGAEGLVSVYNLVNKLSKIDAMFVPCSSGSSADIFMQAFKVNGHRVINAPGLGAMGTGIPGAIGACIASNKLTICINGDGGFNLNIQELETIKRLNLNIKFFVINNGGYASIKAMQNNHFEGRLTGCDKQSGLTLPDIRKVASAYGIKTEIISNNCHVQTAIDRVINMMDGPVVCEVMATDEIVQPRVMSSLIDGKMVTNYMEDMSPLLSREEFGEIMQ